MYALKHVRKEEEAQPESIALVFMYHRTTPDLSSPMNVISPRQVCLTTLADPQLCTACWLGLLLIHNASTSTGASSRVLQTDDSRGRLPPELALP